MEIFSEAVCGECFRFVYGNGRAKCNLAMLPSGMWSE